MNIDWYLKPWQRQALEDQHRFKILVWHRQAKKTTTLIQKMVIESLRNPGVYWMIAPSYRQAKEIIWDQPHMLFNYMPKDAIKDKNKMDLTVYTKTNSILVLKGGDRPDMLRGSSPRGVGIDEYSVQKREVWEQVVLPMVQANQGWAWFNFTPKGKNHAYELWEATAGDKEWFRQMLTVDDTHLLSEKTLKENRKLMREVSYEQEYYCKFVETGGEFFRGIDEAMHGNFEEADPAEQYITSVDLAKYGDYTVISVWRERDNHLVHFDRFNEISWTLQKQRIKSVADKYRGRVIVEANSIGDPMIDELRNLGLSVEPFVTGSKTGGKTVSKQEATEKLSMYIENKYISFPSPDTVRNENYVLPNELRNFGYQFMPSGIVKLQAPSWSTDDFIMSATFACWLMNPPTAGDVVDEPYIYERY
jgi:hypothetical protein